MPSVSVLAAMLQLPLPSAVVLPNMVVPLVLYRMTLAFASVVPVKVGVTTLVMLSVLLEPLSEPALRAGVEPLGAVVSMITALEPASEFALASDGSVKLAMVVPSLVSFMVPLLNSSAVVFSYCRSALVSPACTRYLNVSTLPPLPET